MKSIFTQFKQIVQKLGDHTVEAVIIVVIGLFGIHMLASVTVEASTEIIPEEFDPLPVLATVMDNEVLNFLKPYGKLPESNERDPRYIMSIATTAYNSTPEQCDDTPFITASGTPTRHGVVASNYFPIGTRIKIPDVYGDQVFIVEDRMNARYNKRMDIWMEEYGEARSFGYQDVTIEVF